MQAITASTDLHILLQRQKRSQEQIKREELQAITASIEHFITEAETKSGVDQEELVTCNLTSLQPHRTTLGQIRHFFFFTPAQNTSPNLSNSLLQC